MTKAPQRKRTFWIIFFYTYVSLVAMLLLAIAGLIFWVLMSRDPFDKFEVIAVEKAKGAGRYGPYIATYRYHHSNSSTNVWATWIVDSPPVVGSTEPPPGLAHPVLVWTDPGHVISQQLGERLRVVIQSDVELHEGDLRPCYFSERTDKRICFDGDKVEVIHEMRVTRD